MINLIEKSEHYLNDYLVIPTYDQESKKYSFCLIDRDLNPIESGFNHNFSSVEAAIAVGKSFTDYWEKGRKLE